MENLDKKTSDRASILQNMSDAIRNDDNDAFNSSFTALADNIEGNLRDEIEMCRQTSDSAILASRGVRSLTSEETKFYTSMIDAMRSNVPQQALSELNPILPETTVDQIFDDLRANHPLLGMINFRNTSILTKFILRKGVTGKAQWGELGKEITDELGASFEEVTLTMMQLTAFIPVPRYLLDMGPAWIDRFVRELLSEAIAVGLEEAIINGDGDKKPIGMNKQLTGAIDSVHTDKDATVIKDLSPATYGSILDKLAQGPNKVDRPISRVVLIVNPRDYFTKIFPCTTVRQADGTYSTNVFPFPTTVVQSTAVTAGKAIMGLPEKYFMGLGSAGQGGKIEYSDHFQFLKRNRVYSVVFYGYGKPEDENAFQYLDISGLEPTNLKVEVVENP